MYRSLFFFLLLSVLCCASHAFAQDEAVKEKIYNFDEMLIDGSYRNPQGVFESARSEVSFGDNLTVKLSFIDKIRNDAKEVQSR